MSDIEFKEIGHCGGRVTFTVKTENGRRAYQVGFRHSAPVPASIFAVYAIEQGIAVDTINLGGIGAAWNPAPVPGCFPVFIASDSTGMYGNECPGCNQYWRSAGGAKYCPYCGIQARPYQFLTKAQRRYVKQYCDRLVEALNSEEDGDHVIDMDAVASAAGRDGEKPPFYYSEQSQQNRFTCDACGSVNDILGTYGYCAVCRTRNDLQELEKRIKALRERINAGGPFEGCAKDAVALFDSLAGHFAKQLRESIPLTSARHSRIEQMHFHNIEAVAEMFRSVFDVDVLAGMSADDIAFAKLMFQRRHVYEHRGGEADERYIKESGDAKVKPKQALRESQESAHRIANVVFRLGSNLHRGFHEIFPPDEEPVKRHAERKSRR